MKINNDVQKWLIHVKTSNISRKRKADFDDDNLIKEITLNSIKSIMKIIKAEKVNNKNIKFILEGFKQVKLNSNKLYNKNKDKNIMLLINACTSISIELITRSASGFLNKIGSEEPKRTKNKKAKVEYLK
jgi:hypothetical protein